MGIVLLVRDFNPLTIRNQQGGSFKTFRQLMQAGKLSLDFVVSTKYLGTHSQLSIRT